MSERQSWASLFGLLGEKGRLRAQELAHTLSNFYADDERLIHAVEDVLELAERALDDVDDALGPPGFAYGYNVPTAASVLHVYASAFKEPEKQLRGLG